jgi:replicative DNA helicase
MKQVNYEIQMLARILADRSVFYTFANLLHPGLFIKHGEIYNAMIAMLNADRIPSPDNLIAQLPAHSDAILDMYADLDYTIPVELIIQELHEKYRNYTISNGLTRAGMQATSDEKINILTETLLQLEKNQTRQVIFHAYDVALELVQKLKTGYNPGLLTDFAAFDKHTGGLQPSDLIIIAARASQGKTSLALTITNNIINRGKKVLFISMELSKPQLVLRVLSSDLHTPAKLAMYHADKFEHAAQFLQSKGFYLADVNNVDYRNIMGLIRSSRIKYNIDVAFVDYLQLMKNNDTKGREQEIGSIARAMKNIAKELDIPIVLLSQLKRPENNQYEPKLSDLRDSGQIEEAADIVWSIYRPEYYNIQEYSYYNNGHERTVQTAGRAFHNIMKGRNYGTTAFETGFETHLARFCDTRHSDEPAADRPF